MRYAILAYLSETELDGTFEVHVKKVGVVNDGTFVGDKALQAPLAVGLDEQIAATGTWDLEFGMNDVGLSTGEAVLKDVGKKGKVKGKLYDAFDKTIKLKGQRSENDFNTIVFTGKVNTPLGKQSVTVNLELLDDDLFEGTADVGGIIVEFAGNLQPAAATALKITPPNVTGTWLIEVEDNELDITEGTLVITQKGLKVLATLDADVLDEPVQLKGKFNKKDLDDIISKGRFPIPGSNFRPRLNVTLAINDQQNPTAFTGNIYRSIFGNVIADVDFTGTKQI